MASFGYTLRKRWNKKRDSLRQDRFARGHDILFKRTTGQKIAFGAMFVLLVIFTISFLFISTFLFMKMQKQDHL